MLRLLELEGRPDAAAIVPGASTHELRGYGLATLREDGPGAWRPCDGLERQPNG